MEYWIISWIFGCTVEPFRGAQFLSGVFVTLWLIGFIKTTRDTVKDKKLVIGELTKKEYDALLDDYDRVDYTKKMNKIKERFTI